MSVSCVALYVAGPMRGYPDLNFPAFHDAADRFRRAGFTVRNPVEIGREVFGPDSSAVSPAEFLRADLRVVIECSAMALLPGWERSTGAKAEAAVAVTLGHQFYDAITMDAIPAPCMIEICGGYERPVNVHAALAATPSPEGSR